MEIKIMGVQVKGHPQPNVGVYTVATLPAAGSRGVGDIIFVSNARVASQGSGAGTGQLAYYNGTSWMRVDTGVAVAA